MVTGGEIVRMTKKELDVEIGKRIKNARESAGLTQERFAELLEMGPKNLSSVERGQVGISISMLHKICCTLSISADQLLFDRDDSTDIDDISERLSRLTPTQFKIAYDILNKVIEGFSIK